MDAEAAIGLTFLSQWGLSRGVGWAEPWLPVRRWRLVFFTFIFSAVGWYWRSEQRPRFW